MKIFFSPIEIKNKKVKFDMKILLKTEPFILIKNKENDAKNNSLIFKTKKTVSLLKHKKKSIVIGNNSIKIFINDVNILNLIKILKPMNLKNLYIIDSDEKYDKTSKYKYFRNLCDLLKINILIYTYI